MTATGIARKDLRVLRRINFEEEHGNAQRLEILRASSPFRGRLP
jgi:hypothetical protein